MKLDVPATIKDLAALVRKHRERIVASLPRGVDGDAVLKTAIMEVQKQPALLKCHPASLFWAISEAVQSGLEIGGYHGHCYIVPYGDKAQLQIGYKGMIELVRRTGDVESVSMQLVHEGDHFVHQEGDCPKLEHVPSPDVEAQSRTVTHVYVVVRLKGGSIIRNVWTVSRVNAHRDQYSEAYRRCERYRENQVNSKQAVDPKRLSPWHTSWHNMAFKTVLRDLFSRGLLPFTTAIQQAVTIETRNESAELPGDSLETIIAGILDQPFPTLDAPTAPMIEAQKPSSGGIKERLAAAANLGQVTAIREEFLPFAETDDEAFEIGFACDERAAEIREAKSKA